MRQAKLFLWLLVAGLWIQSQAGVVYIDASTNAAPASGWNGVDFFDYTNVSLVDSNNTSSGIAIEINHKIRGLNQDGLLPTGSAYEFTPISTNNAFGHTNLWESEVYPIGEATFSGLATNRAYTFTFFASRENDLGYDYNRETIYTLTGSNSDSKTLNAANNSSQVAVIPDIYPAPDGTINLQFTAGENNTTPQGFFYIGGIKIEYIDGGSIPDKKLNILFFGNSFTINGSAPELVAKLAEIAGHTKPLAFGDLMGGQDLAYHITQVEDYPENNVNNAVIGTNTWDYVVIQGYSTEATHIGDPVTFTNNAQTLYQDVRDHISGRGAGVKAIMFETWARNPNHSYYPDTFTDAYDMQAEIRTNYWLAVNGINNTEGSNEARFAGVGDAFERAGFPDDFYAGDLYHQSGIGTNLIAMVLYKTIYSANVSDISYTDAVNAGWTTMTGEEWTNLTAYADSLIIPEADPTAPEAPTLMSPADGATAIQEPIFQLSSTDANDDDLQYKVEISDSTDFSSPLYVYDQTISQTGWSGQDAQTETAYTSGSTAILTMQTSLSVGNTYYWRAASKDITGNDEWSSFSATNSFSITDRESIYIDCGAATAPTASWNNVDFSTITSAALIDHNGNSSGINLSISTRVFDINTEGTSSPTGNAADLAPAGGNSAYGSTVEWQGETHPFGAATFSGMDTNDLYTFTFFASRMGVTDNRETIYVLSGSNSDSNTLDAANNASEVTVVSNIQASASGTIDFLFKPGPNNNNNYKFYYLASMRIDVDEDGMLKPNSPVLYEPENLDLCSSNPTFKMSSTDPEGAALQYKIELSTNENFATIDYTYDQSISQTGWLNQDASGGTAYNSGSTGEFTVVSALDDGIYYWRAYAYNSDTHEKWSYASASQLFSVSLSQDPPNPPTLLTPANGASGHQIPTFTLSAVDPDLDYLQFKVEVSANADFTGTVYTYNQNELQASWQDQDADSGTAYESGSTANLVTQRALDSATTYYWRAFAIDPDGSDTWSKSSATNSFTADGTLPIYIDCFGDNAPSATWNNFDFTQAAGTSAMLKYNNGTQSGINLEVVTRCTLGNATGGYVASGAAAEFTPAGDGVAYISGTEPVYTVKGLDSDNLYTFTFFGSREYNGGDIEVTYHATGSNSGSDYLDTSYNSTQTATVTDISPNLDGNIDIRLEPGPATTFNYVYINAMKIEPKNMTVTGMPDPPTLISPINGENVTMFPSLKLSATDNQGDYVVYKIEIAENSDFSSISYTYDQSVSQINWQNQDMHNETAYASGSSASYQVQSSLNFGQTYYWRAYAMDPAGSGEWSSASDVQSFVPGKIGSIIIFD